MRSLRLRDETPPEDHVVVIRGGIVEDRTDDELRKRAHDAEARIGLLAQSVLLAAAADVSSVCLRDGRVSRYGQVNLSTVARLRRAGFALLPTLDAPHYSVVLPDLDSETIQRFRNCFDRPTEPTDHLASLRALGHNQRQRGAYSMPEPDIVIDYMQADVDGFITVDTADLPEGTNEHDHIVVGDHDAEPAVARVLEIRSGRTSIGVLPGAAEDNAALLERRPPTLTA